MLKRMTVVLVVCVCVGVAYGGANKIRYFTACDAQVGESVTALGADADPDGMAILNYASGAGKTIVQIIVSDMTPSQTYSLRLTDGVSAVEVLDAFTTNEEGHGTFHQEFLGTDISEYHVELFVGTTGSGAAWSQLQDPGNPATPYSATSSVNAAGEGYRVADNVDLVAGQEITKIHWRGGTCNAVPSVEEFRVRFYDDAGGQPGAWVYQEDVTLTGTVVGDDTFPDCAVPAVQDEYEFVAELPGGFTPTETATYWVEVVGYYRPADTAVFRWSNATGGPDGVAGAVHWISDGWLNGQPERAFQLIGETDTTELRAVGENPEAKSAPPSCPVP